MTKRRQYIVDRQQYKVTGLIVFYCGFAILLTGLLVFLPSFIGLSAAVDIKDQAVAAQEILILHQRFWPAIIIVSIIVGIHSIFYFHRFFGPLYRFKATMNDIAGGDVSYNFDIRKKDLLTDEKETMNNMINSLRENFVDLKQNNKLLIKSIHQLNNTLEGEEPSLETIHEQVEELRQSSAKVHQVLEKFKVS